MIIEVRQCLVPACEGAKHRFEWDEPTGREFQLIQSALGLTPDKWEAELARMGEEVDASIIDVACMLLAIAHKRAGIPVAVDEVDFKISDLSFIFDPEADPEVDEKPTGPPPTSPPPRVPEPAGTSGADPTVVSEPKSSLSEPASGGSTGSPSPQPSTSP